MSILAQAEKAVTEREKHYGSPLENFERIAALWNVVLGGRLKEGEALSAADVALCMIGLKMARLVHEPEHQDSQVDIAGYAECLSQVA